MAGIYPAAYENENDGRLFRHVVPAIAKRDEISSHGSRRKFGFHVDNPDLPLLPEPIASLSGCPEFLSLLAIRADHQVQSEISFVDDILAGLSEGVKQQLAKPEFDIHRPASFGQSRVTTLPLLVKGDDGFNYLRVDTENVTPTTERSAAALVMLKDLLKTPGITTKATLLPGDFLIIRNQRVLHGRGAFEPRDNGLDRWFVRLFGHSNSKRTLPIDNIHHHIGKDL